MPRNLQNTLIRLADVKSVAGIDNFGMFYTPESIEYIHDWVARHGADVQAHLWTVMAMLVNYQERQLLALAEEQNWNVRFENPNKTTTIPVTSPDDGLRLVRMINLGRTLTLESPHQYDSDDRVADDHGFNDLELEALRTFQDGVNVYLCQGDEIRAKVDIDSIDWEYRQEAAPPA